MKSEKDSPVEELMPQQALPAERQRPSRIVAFIPRTQQPGEVYENKIFLTVGRGQPKQLTILTSASKRRAVPAKVLQMPEPQSHKNSDT